MLNNVLANEEVFHDQWARSIEPCSIMVDESFESAIAVENNFIMQSLGNIKDRKILELGAGSGEASVYFAKKGADVTASDLSGSMLELVQKAAKKHNVTVKTCKCSADKLPFEDETFDIVYAANLLHHVDLEKTCSEVRRVLKCCGGGGAGMFVCIEPLAYNPIINIFRLLTPKIRTRDEHPLKMKDISLISKSFKSFTFQTTWFFANALFLKMFFIERINPNKERYWVRIITHHKKYEKAFCFLHKLDTFFLKIFPFMRKFCRYITMVCVK